MCEIRSNQPPVVSDLPEAPVSSSQNSQAPIASPIGLNAIVPLASSEGVPLPSGGAEALNGASSVPQPALAPVPNAARQLENRPDELNPTIYDWQNILAGQNLNFSANDARERNPNLVPIMLGAGRVALMPNCKGTFTLNDITSHIRAGAEIYAKIQNGDYDNLVPGQNPPAIGEDEVSVVMWYLQALASSSTGQSRGVASQFRTGGILIDDPDGKLKHFLDLTNSYPRRSEHFTQYQNDPANRARGVDVLDTALPNGRRSVLYQKLPDDVPNEGAKMLYVKMEPFGMRGLSTKETGFSAEGLRLGRVSTGKGLFGAIKRFFINLYEKLDRILTPNPTKKVVARYNSFLSSLSNTFSHRPAYMEIIDGLYNLPKHSRAERVRVVYDAVERARRQALELGNTALRKEFLYEFDRFINKLFNLAGDHPRLSFGKDVILTKDDFGPISLLPLSSTEMKNFPVIRNRAFSEREAQIIERYTNFTLSLRGNEQARLISTSNRDFARNGIDLRIFDNPSAERRRAPLYDTRSDPTPRNPDIAIADEIIMAPGDPFLLEVVDQILANFSGSQEFSDIMKCVLGQMNVADLSSIFTYELATQFGVMVGELGYDFLQDNTLTRITPRPGPGVAPPRYVEYEFTAVAQGARIGPPQEEYKDIQADIKVSKKLLLTHDTENNTVTARFIEGHVQYNLTNTIVQPVPEGEQAQDASQVQGS